MGISTTNWNAGRQMLQDIEAAKTNALLDEQRTLSVTAERDRQAQVKREAEQLESGRARMRSELEAARGAPGADLSQYGLGTSLTGQTTNRATSELIANGLATLEGPGVTGQTLASMRDSLSKAKLKDTLGRVHSSVVGMSDTDFADFAKKYSDHSGQEWKFETDPKNGTTKIVLGDRPLGMADRDQVATLVKAQVLRASGYHDEAIAMTKDVLTEMRNGRKESLDTASKVADANNGASYKAGMLGAAQTQAQAAMIRAQRTGDGKASGNGEGGGKALPVSAAKGILENQNNLVRAQTALSLINGQAVPGVGAGDTNATGLKGYLPNQVLNRIDPNGVDTRAAIGDLSSLVIHDRSGAAVTAAEFPRLAQFIPTEKDDPDTVRKKLNQFVNTYQAQVEETAEFYRQSGYNVPTQVFRQGGGKSPKGNQTNPAEPNRPAVPAKGQIYKGHRFLGGDPSDRNSWEVAR